MRAPGVPCWLLLAGLLIPSAPARAQTDSYFEFLIARKLESQGDAKGALAALQRASAADPASAEIHAEIAAFHMRQNDLAAAEKAGRAALARNAGSLEAHRVLGLIHSAWAESATESGQSAKAPEFVAQAITHLEKVVATPGGTTDVTVQYNLGRLYLRNGNADKAIETLSRVVEQNPYSIQARLSLAQAFGAANRDDEAADVLKEAAEDEPRLNSTLGQFYERAGRHAEAADAYKRALEANPKDTRALFALARAYIQQRRPRDVIKLLEPVVGGGGARGPESAPLLVHLGFAYQALGEPAKAIDAMTRAQGAAPGDPSIMAYLVQANLDAKRYAEAAALAAAAQTRFADDLRFTRLHARALFHTGGVSRAIALMESALRARPDDTTMYLAMADLYADAGRVDEGVRTLALAAERFPKASSVPFQLGAILEKAERYADAEKAFRRVLAMEPDNADALNYLGYMLADRNERLDEAISLITRALDLDAGNPSYLDSLGWAYLRRGDLGQAEKHLGEAADALPLNSVVQDHFGDLLARRGRYADAVAAWTRALQGDGQDIDRAAIEKKIRDARAKAR